LTTDVILTKLSYYVIDVEAK